MSNNSTKYIALRNGSSSLVLKHHGVLGMHWGVRRYQNEDGTLTQEGKERYKLNDSPYESHERRTIDTKPRPSLPSKKSSNIFEKAINGASSGLGFDLRARWKNAQDWTDYSDYDDSSWSGAYANELRNEVEWLLEKEKENGLTDEEKKKLEECLEVLEMHAQDIEDLQKKADTYLERYKDTPVGKIETLYNDAVETGKNVVDSISSTVDSAASDVSDFFKNLFS